MSDRPMRALSVRQPWAWAILHAGKDIENRDWWPPKLPPGGLWLGLHASARLDTKDAQQACAELAGGLPPEATSVLGAFVGAILVTAARPSTSRWAVPGAVHWHIGARVAFPEPVPGRGALGLFVVPPDLADACRAQWAQARRQARIHSLPPAPVPTSACRSCGSPILWCETERADGSLGRMPVDAEPTLLGNVDVETRRDGSYRARVNPGPVHGGRMAHHATCPQASEWRKRKGRNR